MPPRSLAPLVHCDNIRLKWEYVLDVGLETTGRSPGGKGLTGRELHDFIPHGQVAASPAWTHSWVAAQLDLACLIRGLVVGV